MSVDSGTPSAGSPIVVASIPRLAEPEELPTAILSTFQYESPSGSVDEATLAFCGANLMLMRKGKASQILPMEYILKGWMSQADKVEEGVSNDAPWWLRRIRDYALRKRVVRLSKYQ